MNAARLPLVDVLRGCALWAMVVFHTVWDLAHFGWIDADFPFRPSFAWFGHAIAASFLLLAGASLVLARHSKGVLWRSRAYWRRWATVAAAAGAVSAASYALFPASPIFFGILHCIALATALAAPLVDAPLIVPLAGGALTLAAPHFWSAPVFDAAALWWTGLGTFQPPSNDWRPFFPWAAFVFLGVALGKCANAKRLFPRHCEQSEAIHESIKPQGGLLRHSPSKTGVFRRPLARNEGPMLRALSFCGRHSLAFYLIHQPILFGFFTLVTLVVPPAPDDGVFLRACAVQCVNQGAEADLCEKSCACVVARAKKQGFWRELAQGEATPQVKSQTHDAAVACYADSAR
jgi:uncharacterized membrane protein